MRRLRAFLLVVWMVVVCGVVRPTIMTAAPHSLPPPQFTTVFTSAKGCTEPPPLYGVTLPNPAMCTVPDETPLGSFVVPPIGGTYVDPNFGGLVKILAGPDVFHPYALPTAVSANNRYVAVLRPDGHSDVVDVMSPSRVFRGAPYSGQGRFWDPIDSDVYYYVRGAPPQIIRHTFSRRRDQLVIDYSSREFKFTGIKTGGSSELTSDYWLAFWVPAQDKVCALDVANIRTYCATYTAPHPMSRVGWAKNDDNPDFVMITKGIDRTTNKRYVLLMTGPAMGVWSVNLAHQRLDFEFRGPEDPEHPGNGDGICDPGEHCLSAPHGDTFADSDGKQYLVFAAGSESPCERQLVALHIARGVEMWKPRERGGGKTTIMGVARCSGDEWPDYHIGCARAAAYCVLSTFRERARDPADRTSPMRGPRSPHLGEIIVMRGAGLEIRRVAMNRSVRFTTDEYWSQPRACISDDGKYVVYTSNFGIPNAHRVVMVATGF